jgi:enterochelin esterase-like enzyme
MGESEIVKELIPLIDTKYRTLPDHRVVIGFSMGASGAVRLAVKHPDLFAAAVGWGGGYRGTANSAHEHLDAIKQRRLGLMLIIGDKDNVTLNQAFTAELEQLAIPYTYKVLPGVAHDYSAYLNGTWAEVVDFLALRLSP